MRVGSGSLGEIGDKGHRTVRSDFGGVEVGARAYRSRIVGRALGTRLGGGRTEQRMRVGVPSVARPDQVKRLSASGESLDFHASRLARWATEVGEIPGTREFGKRREPGWVEVGRLLRTGAGLGRHEYPSGCSGSTLFASDVRSSCPSPAVPCLLETERGWGVGAGPRLFSRRVPASL